MSDKIFPQRLTKVDALSLPDHTYLNADDDCYFLGEYTSHTDFNFSETNDLISNLKKEMDKKGLQEWYYKERDMGRVSETFRVALENQLDQWTFVPIPPSKTKDNPLYDDRMTLILNGIRPRPPLDVRELIVQTQSTEAAHTGAVRLSPEEIEALYVIDEGLCQVPIAQIAIVDDVLTAGSHFRAAKSVLTNKFPTTRIIGLFIARRVFAPETGDISF